VNKTKQIEKMFVFTIVNYSDILLRAVGYCVSLYILIIINRMSSTSEKVIIKNLSTDINLQGTGI
jgi:hypothetical protein